MQGRKSSEGRYFHWKRQKRRRQCDHKKIDDASKTQYPTQLYEKNIARSVNFTVPMSILAWIGKMRADPVVDSAVDETDDGNNQTPDLVEACFQGRMFLLLPPVAAFMDYDSSFMKHFYNVHTSNNGRPQFNEWRKSSSKAYYTEKEESSRIYKIHRSYIYHTYLPGKLQRQQTG